MKFEFDRCRYGVVFGAGHGIGLALVKDLINRNPELKIFATYRIEEKAEELLFLGDNFKERLEVVKVDPTNESDIFDFGLDLKSKEVRLDFVMNSVGVLHNDKMQPEKSLRSVGLEQFMESFKVNSVVSAIIAKHFEKLLHKSSPTAFVSLSAKVGSIGDNKMGGWYSYRASKAALNMILQTIAIEFKRKRLNCLVLPIHPGTTKTELSKPFLENTQYKLHSPEESASNILDQVEGRRVEESGRFVSWNGEQLLW